MEVEAYASPANRKHRPEASNGTAITGMRASPSRMALRGDEPLKIMRRAGHSSLSTTMIYVREAENLEHPVGEPFGALPARLRESSGETSEGPATWGLLRGNYYGNRSVPSGM